MKITIPCFLLVVEAMAQEVVQNPFQFSANTTNSCHEACTTLVDRFGEGQEAFYREPQSLFHGYDGYYSLRHLDAVPTCLITPGSARDVSAALRIIIQHSCKFAVKSGGHSMFPGGASINDGVVFDLRHLNQLGLSEDKATAFVGPGNRWGAVYSFLDPMNLTVVGGRVAGVGVGGYLLGGGISYISKKYGWGCDNVRNYEVVLANGSVTNINQKSDPDLYWALRGGGNNFGIVTRFDLETYPLEPMWGGSNVLLLSDVHNPLSALEITRPFSWSMSWAIKTASETINSIACRIGYCTSLDTFAELLESHIIDAEPDLDAQTYLALAFMPSINLYAIFLQFTHGRGLDGSPSFAELKQLKSLYSSNRLTVNSDLAMEQENFQYRDARVSWCAITTKVNSALLKEIMKIFLVEVEPIRNLKGFGTSLPIQLITKEEISHFSKNGGNPLGIIEEDGPLFLINACLFWKNAEDDEVVLQAQTNIIDKSVALAKQMGLHHPFIFQNYARYDQDVFAGYGLENRKRLQEIQKKYDPDGVFSRLQPGYFKV